MKLKLTVAALAAAFAAPMANADVTIAGTFAPFVGHSSTDAGNAGTSALGAPVAATASQSGVFLNDASSRFSITSTEDLGDGMNAGAFVELRGSNGTFPSYNATGGGGESGFNAFRYGVSVGGGWGKLEIGRNFSPYTWTLIIEHPDGQGPVWFGAFSALGQTGGQALNLNGGTALHAFFRTGTGLHFTSANYGGLSFRAAYMTESNKNNSLVAGGSTPETSELSVSADYKPEGAPYYLGAVYSTRADANGAGAQSAAYGVAQTTTAGTTLNSTDSVMLLGGGLKFGDLKIGLWMDRVKYKTSNVTAGLSDISRTAFWIPVTYNLPTGVIGASYLKANDVSGTRVGAGGFNTGDTGVSVWQASYFHNLSKQTQPFVMFQRASNGALGVYAGPQGATATSIIAGIQHSF